MKAEKEITRVRGQVEQLEGRLRFLDNRVLYSSIHITLQDKPGPETIIPAKSYSVKYVLSNATRSLILFSQKLLSLGIWIVVWSPIWLPVVVISLWGIRRKRGYLS